MIISVCSGLGGPRSGARHRLIRSTLPRRSFRDATGKPGLLRFGRVIRPLRHDSPNHLPLVCFMNASAPPPGVPCPGHFPTTHWSRVIAAGDPDTPEGREALAALCNAYWYPIYAYIRRRGHTPEQAQDLTQDFFAYVLERDLLAKADPDRGRFRSFLRAVFARHLANQRDRANARKRGGGRPALSIDACDAEGRYAREPAHELTPERIFDRSWALTLLGRVFDQLRREYDDAGRAGDLRGAADRPDPRPRIRFPTRRSPSGSGSARGPSVSPSIASDAATACCSARRSPPPSTTLARSMTRSAPCSPRSRSEKNPAVSGNVRPV